MLKLLCLKNLFQHPNKLRMYEKTFNAMNLDRFKRKITMLAFVGSTNFWYRLSSILKNNVIKKLVNKPSFTLTVVVVKMSWQGWALSVSTLFDGALVSKESKSKRKSHTAKWKYLVSRIFCNIWWQVILTAATLLDGKLTIRCRSIGRRKARILYVGTILRNWRSASWSHENTTYPKTE